MISQSALKFDVQVSDTGRVELAVPFPPGAHVIVFVPESPDELSTDLLSAAQSSLEFWSNPYDDEDWNNA